MKIDIKTIFARQKKDPLAYRVHSAREWYLMLGLFFAALIVLLVGSYYVAIVFSAKETASLETSADPNIPRVNKELLQKTVERYGSSVDQPR